MTFKPEQPRDDKGRWKLTDGRLPSALTSLDNDGRITLSNDEIVENVITTTPEGAQEYYDLAASTIDAAGQWEDLSVHTSSRKRTNELEGIGTYLEDAGDQPLRVSIDGIPLEGYTTDQEELFRLAYTRRIENDKYLSAMRKAFIERPDSIDRVENADAIRYLAWRSQDAADEEEQLADSIGIEVANRIREEVNPVKHYEHNPNAANQPKPRFSPTALKRPTGIYEEIALLQGRSMQDVSESVSRNIANGMTSEDALVQEYGAHAPSGEMVGIDLETTGLSSNSAYIVDAGWETMDMRTGEAYDAGRSMYGLRRQREALGIPASVSKVSGITADKVEGLRPFHEDREAQARIMHALNHHTMVAHNASFEKNFLMNNCTGFAEALRSGDIRVVDSLRVAQHSEDTRDAGFRLNDYAKRNGALGADRAMQVRGEDGRMMRLDQGEEERHLGLEDTHIMLAAMRNQLNTLHDRYAAGRPVKEDVLVHG